jgi:hypothetical protein
MIKPSPERQRQLPVHGRGHVFFAFACEGVAGAQFGDEFGDAVLIVLREIGRMAKELAVAPDKNPYP